MKSLSSSLTRRGRVLLSGTPEGLDALALSEILADPARPSAVVHVARDDGRMARMAEALTFFAPGTRVLSLPAWDCLPYDRVSPNPEIVARRVAALSTLADDKDAGDAGTIVLTTASALLQRVPARSVFHSAVFAVARGERLDIDTFNAFLVDNGYNRTGTVREAGEYAVRGGIVDLFPPGFDEPFRLDLFGDEVEAIRAFDPVTQRTTGTHAGFALKPVSEISLTGEAIARFRTGYRDLFGSISNDPLYTAISEGRKQIGMEHWLPLFHDRMETVFDYVDGAAFVFDHQAREAVAARFETIADYYDSRMTFLDASSDRGKLDDASGAPPYRPLPPDRLYLTSGELEQRLGERPVADISPFASSEDHPQGSYTDVFDLKGRRVHDFAAARNKARAEAAAEGDINVFDAVRDYARNEQAKGRQVIVAAFTPGSRERMRRLMEEHGIGDTATVDAWPEAASLPGKTVGLAVLGLEHGFTTPATVFIGEQDIIGDRMVRPARKARRAEDFIASAGELSPGDLVVHIDHGIGRYDGLETLTVSNAPHDCLKITYADDNRLFVPVENIEVLSRYGSDEAGASLDRLGGAAWQARKARLKDRLKMMAGELIKIAAERQTKKADALIPAGQEYHEFCARFPYQETDDQGRAIEETLQDLATGRPMDRLVCGDVGFGKTEIALRAAFAAVSAGDQVAVVVPTTLLCRQHYKTFVERFNGLPVRIRQLSRLVTAKEAGEIRDGIADGGIDIVIGTHALLGKAIRFSNLGLLVVDEEQHFGVRHKERLKQLKSNVHVLTLTATPIPRTLQMALTGVKEMSVIATPPVDRLAVRTFVLPYDPVVIKEALMREHFRGGQSFYVCPRISDMDDVAERLRRLVPDIKIGMAHGRMPTAELERVMNDFYDGRLNLLLSTQIVESGLDIPTANTLIIHRADMFGLAQLYQLRGRIGRSKLRAYCYLTLPMAQVLTPAAQKRLEVMQALDTLGAGFTLASHDLDIRGAGNLLGEEQSGHIKEVGAELYQQLLEEAVAMARGKVETAEETWTPQINVGMPVLIPEKYVSDLGIRLGLYRRIAAIESEAESDSFAAELIDRFGAIPPEVENLLQIIAIKRHCKAAGIDKLEAGPKGAVLAFHGDHFANPAGLIDFITKESGRTKLRPDHRLVYRRDWENPKQRLTGAARLVDTLARIASAG